MTMGCYGLAGSGWAGRTRREPIHGGSMAPSMAPTVLPAHPDPARQGFTSADGKSVGFPSGKRGQIRFPAENGSDPGRDLAFCSLLFFLQSGVGYTETVRGREGGLRRGVSAMGPRHASGGLAGRPTPVLPCAQDSAHEQGAPEPTRTYSRRPLRNPPSRPTLSSPAFQATHPEGLRRWLDIRIPRKRTRPGAGPGRVRGSGQAGVRTPASLRRPVRWPSGDRQRCGGPAVPPVPGRPAQWLAGPGLRRRAGR